MVAGCGNKCVKFTFFTFNLLFFLLGAAVLGLSLWLRFDNGFQKRFGDTISSTSGTPLQIDQMYIALYVCAAIGGLLCLLGFLGCCGACCESVCVLGLFFTLVLVLFLAQLAAGIYIFVKKDTIKDNILTWYKENVIDKYSTNADIQKQLDQMQRDLQCCGSRGCGDYNVPPDSCGCSAVGGNREGCASKMFDEINKHIVVVAVVAIAILVIELLSMIFACILCNAIRSSSYDYY